MFNSDKKIKPVLFDGLDAIFDERGSTFAALRLVQWCSEDDTPNREKAKYELRKWRVDASGEERADKGLTFLTEEGPHELVNVLLKNNFGKTKEVLKVLKDREDFKESVEHLYEGEDVGDGEFFDMRTALLTDNEVSEDEDEE